MAPRPALWNNPQRPAHNAQPTTDAPIAPLFTLRVSRQSLALLLVVAGLLIALGGAIASRQAGPMIYQEFRGPVNAPVVNRVSADQRADVDAQVQQ